MWALSDFTEEVGATRVVLGSQDWSRERVATLEDSVAAVMPKGSVVIYTNSTIHGSGPNLTADQNRIGLNVDYNLGLLRTEENQYLSCPPEIMCEAPVYMQRLCGYTKIGACRSFADYQHPKAALEMASHGFMGHHRVDWASAEPWESRPWRGHSGINAQIMEKHLHDQPWRWGAGAQSSEDPGYDTLSTAGYDGPVVGDTEVPPDMMVCAMEPEKRWDEFQQTLAKRVAALPPPPVSVAWDPEQVDAVGEELVAAIYRDGAAILTGAVSEDRCARVIADMKPYMDHAAEQSMVQREVDGSVENRSTRVTALPTRSEHSWEMITHPAIIDVTSALLGRQILDMSKTEVSRRMGGRAKQVRPPATIGTHGRAVAHSRVVYYV